MSGVITAFKQFTTKNEAEKLEKYKKQLFSACENGNEKKFLAAFEYCAPRMDINEIQDDFGNSILAVAAKYGRVKFVADLLDAGADPLRGHAYYGTTPAHLAAEGPQHSSSDSNSVNVLQWLARIDQRSLAVRNREGRTPLHVAAAAKNLPVVKYLSFVPHLLNLRDHDGRTALDKVAALSVTYPEYSAIAFILFNKEAETAGCATFMMEEIYRTKVFPADKKLLKTLLKANPEEGIALLRKAIARGDTDGGDTIIQFLCNDCNVELLAAEQSDPPTASTLLTHQTSLLPQGNPSAFFQTATKVASVISTMGAAAPQDDMAITESLDQPGGIVLPITHHAGNTPSPMISSLGNEEPSEEPARNATPENGNPSSPALLRSPISSP